MCCFSQSVISVSATSIFARPDATDRQFLAYSMRLNADKELAMVLPLPVKPGTPENGVTFIDLSGYPDFFTDLRSGFPVPTTRAVGCSKSADALAPAAATLEVVKVGSFEASFVPSVKDFSRLDERFRISEDIWKKIPGYEDFGFAVFKLQSGEATIHPMAFSFPRRNVKSLFFPTVHIHDGEVHPEAEFDHVLYCQPSEQRVELHQWEESPRNAGVFMKVDKTKGLIVANQHCYQKKMHGQLPNRDTVLPITT